MLLPARPLSSLLLVVALALTFAIAGSLAWSTASAATVAVNAGNNYFCSVAFDGAICNTDVTAGDTVTWTMVGGSHTVTQCNQDFSECPSAGGWDSGILSKNDTYSQTFASPGTYAYRCELHPSEMRGKIIVAAVTPSPTPIATVEPTSGSVSSATTTPMALPQTGGAPGAGDASASLYIPLGVALLSAAALALVAARRQT